MIVENFSQNCKDYKGFQVWEVENLESFLKGNKVLSTIFQDVFEMTYEEFVEKRDTVEETDFEIMTNMLKLVGDKHFFMFTIHDDNHIELVGMQKMKVMNFGMDIEQIRNDRVYVMIMDKIEVKHL